MSPGIVMDSFPPGRDLGDTSAVITVSSYGGFSGGVFLGVACCRDVMRQRTAPLAPGLVWFWQGVPGNYVTVANNSPGSATLNLNLSGYGSSLNNQPTVRYGKYLMTVTGTAQGAGHTGETTVAITVLPEIIGRSPYCVSSPPNPSGHPAAYYADSSTVIAITALIGSAEQSPPRPTTRIAVYQNPNRAVRLDITTAAGFADDSALVGISNLTSGATTKAISTSCVSVSQRRETQAAAGGVAVMTIRRSTDRSVVVRERVCAGFFCLSPVWLDLIEFADEGFWDAFGGKSLTFTVFPP